MLCIGLYRSTNYLSFLINFIPIMLQRLRYAALTSVVDATSKRYVITNPPFDFGLLPTDQVFQGKDCLWTPKQPQNLQSTSRQHKTRYQTTSRKCHALPNNLNSLY